MRGRLFRVKPSYFLLSRDVGAENKRKRHHPWKKLWGWRRFEAILVPGFRVKPGMTNWARNDYFFLVSSTGAGSTYGATLVSSTLKISAELPGMVWLPCSP